jgi:anaerobic selenocysteine-containing dehydrogenase
MNQLDMNKKGLKKEDVVDLYNYTDGIERIARKFLAIPYPIPEGCTATYFPEANVLVPISSVAEKSNTPVSKLVVIKLKKRPVTDE